MPPKRTNTAAKAAASQPVALRRSARSRSPPERYTPPPHPPPRRPARKAAAKVAKVPAKGKRKAKADVEPRQSKKVKANDGGAARGPGRPRKIATASKPSEKLAASKAKAAPQNRKIAKATKPSAKAAKAAAPKTAPRPKAAAKPKAKAAPKTKKALPVINTPPTQKLDIFAFGEGSNGELGLGAKHARGRMVIDVKRPRLNTKLAADTVGVVALAVGGMHCVALTHDNKLLSWGVNDAGALGRDSTSDEVKLKDADADDDGSDSDSEFDEDSGLNPLEATPTQIDPAHFEAGTVFASVFAGDNMSFAVTTTGLVYGWGSFRGVDGPMGFSPKVKTASTPVLMPELKGIVTMATGTNHVLALNNKGRVFVFGAGEQSQLGRKLVARTASGALVPRELPLAKKHVIKAIGAGDYNGFAVTTKGELFSWGLNTFGQTGVAKNAIDDDLVNAPTLVRALEGHNLLQVQGGAHNTIALNDRGEVVVWGRVDGFQSGIDLATIPQNSLFYEGGQAKFLMEPAVVPNIHGAMVSTGPDSCCAVATDGKAYSWGFSESFQTGHGVGAVVKSAQLIDNSAIRDKQLVFCGVGGQFTFLGGIPAAEEGGNVASGSMNANAV